MPKRTQREALQSPSSLPTPVSQHGNLTFNHLSTHLVWNSWLQGRTRSSCRASKSLKQTTHLGGGVREHHPHPDGKGRLRAGHKAPPPEIRTRTVLSEKLGAAGALRGGQGTHSVCSDW